MVVMWEAEILTLRGGGGGGAEVIYFNWCWGGGQVFWADRIAPSKNSNLHDLERLKIFVTTSGSRKIVMGSKPNNVPPTRKKWHGPHVERKDCPHRKNTPKGETPPLPHGFFYSCSTLWRAPTSPPCRRRSWSPLTLFCLFERVRKKIHKKSTKTKIFWLFHLTF